MYKDYFGLKGPPFSIVPDPHYLYMSGGHREALAHLLYGIGNDGGFVLLTGEVGTGKTTICRCLFQQLPDTVDIAFILNPKLNAPELLAAVCDELHIYYDRNAAGIKIFVDAINTYLLDSHAKGHKTVLVIEEAQNLAPDVLEQVRLLTNLETDERKLLQIIMIGQPELRQLLAEPGLKQLAQRITARYHLTPLSKEDVAAYVAHRLRMAGAYTDLFSRSAIRKLYKFSGGIPRLINVICDRALLGAYIEGRKAVDVPILKKAAREVLGESGNKKKWSRLFRRLVSSTAPLSSGRA